MDVLNLASAVFRHTDGDLFRSVLQGLDLYVLYYAIRVSDVELLSRRGSGRPACSLLLSDELVDDRLKHSLSLSLLLLLGFFTPSLQASLYLVSAGLIYPTLVTRQRVYLTPRLLELVHNGIEDALIELALTRVLYVSASGFFPRATEHLLKVSYLLLVYFFFDDFFFWGKFFGTPYFSFHFFANCGFVANRNLICALLLNGIDSRLNGIENLLVVSDEQAIACVDNLVQLIVSSRLQPADKLRPVGLLTVPLIPTEVLPDELTHSLHRQVYPVLFGWQRVVLCDVLNLLGDATAQP